MCFPVIVKLIVESSLNVFNFADIIYTRIKKRSTK